MTTQLDSLLETTRRITSRVIEPEAERADAEGAWPEAGLRALLSAGLGGLVAPVEVGGHGFGLRALLSVCETIAEADASCALCLGMHSVAVACVAAKATPEQEEAFLRPVCEGRHLTTLALSEPGSGSEFYFPATRMESGPEGWRVNGEKCFVTSGGHADSYVLSTVATGPEAPPGHFSLVVVPKDASGLTWGGPWEGWGMRGNSSRSVSLTDVRVPRQNLLGSEGDQIWYVFHVVAPFFLVSMAGTYLGVASRAVRETVAHLGGRRHAHSGRALSQIDILQHRLGTVWAKLQRTRQLCYWAAEAGDAQSPDALPALCAAKAEVAHGVVDIVNDCMTLSGGIAYRDGSVLQRLLRDARAAHVMSPTTDMLYTWAGRALLDLPLLGE